MTRLYVGNIPFSSTEQDLADHFAIVGNVLKVDVVTDRDTGRSRGFAFVNMDDASADVALALNGSEFGGRRLVVNPAKEKPRRSDW